MKHTKIPNCKIEKDHLLTLVNGGNLISELILIFIIGSIVDGTVLIAYVITGAKDLSFFLMLLILPHSCLFFVWLVHRMICLLVGVPSFCSLDRKSQSVHFRSRRYKLSLPWHQVHFKAQYFPSPSGGGSRTEFFVLGSPPFPEGILPKDPKKLRKVMERGGGAFNFGSFSVKDSDEAQRWERFFNAFMETLGPAEDLYRYHVLAGGVGHRFSGLADL